MVHDTRELNRSAVLAQLLRSRPTSRKQIATATGVSPATVSRLIDQLITEGVVVEGDDIVVENRGRRARSIDFVADQGHVLGIDLGASNVRFLVADLVGAPVLTGEQPTPAGTGALELAEWLAAEVQRAAAGLWPSIRHVSIGLPGAVDEEAGAVSNAPNLPAVEDPRFLTAVASAMARPIRADNDANYALLGEQRFGAALGHPTAAMLTLGAGLGAGLAIDGRIVRGARGLIGEFGQLPVGPLGTRLEHLVTGPGILRRAAEAGVELTSPADLFAVDAQGVLASLRTHFDNALLIVLTAITVSCEPRAIVLGGGISKSLLDALPRYEAALQQNLRYSPSLVPAAFGDFSGAIGATVSSLHAVYGELGIDEYALVDLPAAGAAVTRLRSQPEAALPVIE
jgi:glucokinase